ncbi:hypothetical protein [Allorhodopirellula heiligendammensis]|nr:hypothetical protein [Allorhodopirellula heiligendammensis]
MTIACIDVGAGKIAAMHGPHRFPAILKRFDRLSRGDSPARKQL